MKSLFVTALTLGCTMAFAADEATTETLAVTPELTATAGSYSAPKASPNIRKSNIAVSGSIGMNTYKNNSYSETSYYIYPSVEYFVMDRLSLGGSIVGSFEEDYRTFGYGPSLTGYVWSNDKMAASVGAGYLLKQSRYSDGEVVSWSTLYGTVSYKYFLVPEVAFGPTFKIQQNSYPTRTTFGSNLELALSVFL